MFGMRAYLSAHPLFLCIDALYFQDSGVWQPTVYQLIFCRARRSYRNVCIVNQRKMRLAE